MFEQHTWEITIITIDTDYDQATTHDNIDSFQFHMRIRNVSDFVFVSLSVFFLFCVSSSAFVREFLFKLSEIEDHEKTTGICKVAYNDTLAQFHPWLVRKGALVAMYALPTREQLLNKVCQDVERSIALLPDVLHISKVVYERTEQLYSDFNLHELP